MMGSRKTTILVIDCRDGPQSPLIAVLAREPSFEVSVTGRLEEAITRFRESAPDVILCDGSVPWVGALEFCRTVRSGNELPITVFIIVGPPHGIDEKERALEAGIDDWIEKSVPASIIVGKIKAWLRMKNTLGQCMHECEALRVANNRLSLNFKELTLILVKILDTCLPGLSDRADVAKAIGEYMAEKLRLGEEERKKILFAALVHEIGKVGLPRSIAERDYHSLSMAEKEALVHHPAIGSMIISTVTGLKDSADAVYQQLENYDGSGVPDGLMGDEITLGAKILRAVNFQEELYRAGLSTETVIERIKASAHKILDPAIADYLVRFLEERDASLLANKSRLILEELKPGMTLAEDVYSANGIKLLPKGVVLQEKMISILWERNSVDPIIGGIYVLKD